MKNKKIGLALGSGAARGLTHIGVLKAIEEQGIKIDYISGSSIGALIGAAYAIGMSAQEIEDVAVQTNWKLMVKIFSPTLSLSSLVNTNYLSEFLSTWFGNKTFDDLKIPFSAVTTDIQTGKMVILEKGDLLSAIRASISIPVIFSPVTIGKHKLVRNRSRKR
jgi:NTE family protein